MTAPAVETVPGWYEDYLELKAEGYLFEVIAARLGTSSETLRQRIRRHESSRRTAGPGPAPKQLPSLARNLGMTLTGCGTANTTHRPLPPRRGSA